MPIGLTSLDSILLDDDLVENTSGSTIIKTKSVLMTMISNMEMDPIQQKTWIQNAIDKSGEDFSMIDSFMTTPRFQTGGLTSETVELGTMYYMMAPPQLGKTQGVMATILEAAVEKGMPSVIACMNSRLETPRFRKTADGFNSVVMECARAIGISSSDTPSISIYDSSSPSGGYSSALNNWKLGLTKRVPVYVVMTNTPKIRKFRRDIIPILGDVCGIDDDGRVSAMMVVDEADLLFKTASENSKLEQAVFGGEPIVLGDSSHDNIHDMFSSIVYVTATPQSMVTSSVPVNGRRTVIIEPEPSSNNWQYHAKPGWACKIIDREHAGNVGVMIDDMVADDCSRVALISTTKETRIDKRSVSARKSASLYTDVPGFVSFSWSSGVIEVYTSDPKWICVLKSARPGVFSFTFGVDGISKFVGTKSINSYPRLISFMMKSDMKPLVYKFVLRAHHMAERAMPIKGDDHSCPLTDMYLDAHDIHYEARIQVAGRLCGMDPEGIKKTLWSSKKQHDKHIRSIDCTHYVIDHLLRHGIGSREAIAATNKTLIDLTEETAKVTKIVVDEHGALTMLKGRVTRPEARRNYRDMASDVRSEARDVKRVKIGKFKYSSTVKHSPTPEISDDEGGDSDMSDYCESESEEDVVVIDDTCPVMEMVGNHSVAIGKAIAEAIVEAGGNISSAGLAGVIGGSGHYPDGASFTPQTLLRVIGGKMAASMAGTGFTFENGFYASIN
jgi:hypothetical protein